MPRGGWSPVQAMAMETEGEMKTTACLQDDAVAARVVAAPPRPPRHLEQLVVLQQRGCRGS